jgi:serine protease
VAPGCRILPVKIFHADKLAADERVADAIRYAARHADVLSCSWTCGASPDIRFALEDTGAERGGKGAAIFCAAGNDGGGPVSFPAREAGAIAVGASTDEGRRAGFSNLGPELSLVAPSSGGLRGIFTTAVAGGRTDRFGGTSASTALAAGTAALVLSEAPGLTREELKELLESTADKIAGPYDARGHSDETGFGRVNAGKAVFRVAK